MERNKRIVLLTSRSIQTDTVALKFRFNPAFYGTVPPVLLEWNIEIKLFKLLASCTPKKWYQNQKNNKENKDI